MLARMHDPEMEAIVMSQMCRDAMERIQIKMAAQQLGEAFNGIDMPELPKFLKYKKGDAEKIKQWNAEHPIGPAQQAATFGGRKDRKVTIEFEKELVAAMRDERLRLTGKAGEDDEPEEHKAKGLARRAKKAAGPAAEDHTEQYWDTAACKWRPIGYMSARKYASLIAYMPSPAHKAAFIEMFGHTQTEEARNPPVKVLEARRKAAQEAARATASAKRASPAKPKKAPRAGLVLYGLGPAKHKGQNPEHVAKVSAMLTRPEGATLAEIGTIMGWQEHSASAFLSGIRKTRTIVKTVEDRGNVYRLEATQ